MAEQTFTSGQILTAAQMTTLQTNIGMNFVKSQTIGTGVSTVVVNDAFSSDYENYKIIISGGATSTFSSFYRVQLGSITSGWYGHITFLVVGSSGFNADQVNNLQWSYVALTGDSVYTSFEISNPNTTSPKQIVSSYVAQGSSSFSGQGFTYNTSSTQQTAFTISASAGTLTGGTITVYGYRKA